MKHKLLGRSGLRVSEVALGAMTFSDRGLSWGSDPGACKEMFDVFAEAGGTFIDTANIYGDMRGGDEGASERVLGSLIKSDRGHFVVASKYTSSNTDDISRSGNSFKNMRQTVDASLKRLQTDYLDLLWLHTWTNDTPIDEVLLGANQLINAGKILYFGFSDTPAWVVSQAVARAESQGWHVPIGIQIEYSLIERTPERELMPMAHSLDLGVAPWSPLARGVLTGKYTADAGKQGRTRLSDAQWQTVGPDKLSERERPIAEAVDSVASRLGYRPSQVALAWLRQRPGVVIPIIGARSGAQLKENLEGLELVLSGEELSVLDRVSAPELGFPQGFLGSDVVRGYGYSGRFDQLDNHKAHAYAEFSSPKRG